MVTFHPPFLALPGAFVIVCISQCGMFPVALVSLSATYLLLSDEWETLSTDEPKTRVSKPVACWNQLVPAKSQRYAFPPPPPSSAAVMSPRFLKSATVEEVSAARKPANATKQDHPSLVAGLPPPRWLALSTVAAGPQPRAESLTGCFRLEWRRL